MNDKMYVNHTCPNCHTSVNFELDMGDYPSIIVEACPECNYYLDANNDRDMDFYCDITDQAHMKYIENERGYLKYD